MGCDSFLKFVLIFTNVILSLVFLAVAIFGAILTWGSSTTASLVETYLLPLINQLNQSSNNNGINVEVIVKFIQDSSHAIGLGLFIIGLVLFIICFLGCIGACCRVKPLLIIYVIFMFILIAAELVFVIIYFTKKSLLLEELRKQLEIQIKGYVSISDSSFSSIIFNLLQGPLGCCGIKSYKDFDNAPNFKRTQTYQGQSYVLVAPITCCKMNSKFEIEDTSCPATMTPVNSNIDKGCLEEISVFTAGFANPFLYGSIGIILFQVLLAVCAILLICCCSDSKSA